GLGVLTPGMGIFHLVFSYAGKLSLSVLADRDIMPDPEFYHDCLVASYEELYSAAMVAAGTSKAAVAKARIKSPKRKRATATDTKKAAVKAKTKAGVKTKTSSKAKTKAA
ncbi:MAG: WS/DGAT domain-containing protein, partial [Halioglobus sp.]